MNLFSNINNVGVRYGLTAGLFTVAYFGVFYLLSKDWMLSPVVYYGSLVIYLWAMYRAMKVGTSEKKELLTWREAVRIGFVVFLVANLAFMLQYVMLHQADPALEEIQRANLRAWYPRIIPKDQLQERLRELDTANLKMTFSNGIFAYARAAIGGFILSALLATIYRRDAIKF